MMAREVRGGAPYGTTGSIGVLQAREYVNKTEGRFKPTLLGRMLVTTLLSPSFDDILDVEYTAKMEEQLDEIENGKANYRSTLENFYEKFEKDLADAKRRMPNLKEKFTEYARVLKVTKRPDSVEFKTIVKASGIGITVIGVMGFIIAVIVQLIQTL